mmetsp:Transcript_12304/g.49569  ORF Transcript_12304/g.49569 Transcript_12304/m.49569 type:complete len:249 (-) Transcript_12304:120-866(-)
MHAPRYLGERSGRPCALDDDDAVQGLRRGPGDRDRRGAAVQRESLHDPARPRSDAAGDAARVVGQVSRLAARERQARGELDAQELRIARQRARGLGAQRPRQVVRGEHGGPRRGGRAAADSGVLRQFGAEPQRRNDRRREVGLCAARARRVQLEPREIPLLHARRRAPQGAESRRRRKRQELRRVQGGEPRPAGVPQPHAQDGLSRLLRIATMAPGERRWRLLPCFFFVVVIESVCCPTRGGSLDRGR